MTSRSCRPSRWGAATAVLAALLAGFSPGQVDSKPAPSLAQIGKAMEDLRAEFARAPTGAARAQAKDRVQRAAADYAEKVPDSGARSAEDSLILGRLLVDADRGNEAVAHLVTGLKGTPGGLTPVLKLMERTSRTTEFPDLSKGMSEGQRKRLAAELKAQAEAAGQLGRSLEITCAFGLAFAHVRDEATFSLLVSEAKRIFGSVEPLGVSWEGMPAGPLGLMGLRGTKPEVVRKLGGDYLNLLASDRRREPELVLGLLGRKTAITDVLAITAAGSRSPPPLEGRVSILHFFRPDGNDQSLRHLVRLVAAHPELSVVGITFFKGTFEDVGRGIPERTGLSEQAEAQLMLEARDARKCSWPWFTAGRWKAREPSSTAEPRPRMFAHHHVMAVPTFIVVDRSSTIRYVHAGEGDLAKIDEAVAALFSN